MTSEKPKLTKHLFITMNAALISHASSWMHSLLIPWPDPQADANSMGSVERYLNEMQERLNDIRREAGLPTLHAEGYREGAEAMRERCAIQVEVAAQVFRMRADSSLHAVEQRVFDEFGAFCQDAADAIRALPAPQNNGGAE